MKRNSTITKMVLSMKPPKNLLFMVVWQAVMDSRQEQKKTLQQEAKAFLRHDPISRLVSPYTWVLP